MLEVSEELKNEYKKESVSKDLSLHFDGIDIGNTNLKTESMSLTESICSDTELVFGGCESAEFKITVADITEDLNGQTFTVAQVLDNNPDMVMPLGTYTVKSCNRQSDRRFKDIIAYDDMIKLDRDVVDWYKSRPWPVALKALRESLLDYCGIAYEPQDLTNDSILINKTLRPASMNGRDVMKRICELNGGFGHITRQNKFKVITLAGIGTPAEIIDGKSTFYLPESTYEDYICRAIDQIRIRTVEEDKGVVSNAGQAGANEYIVQGNSLIADKSKEELSEIAQALFLAVKNKAYRPHHMVITGLPYLEVGDSVVVKTKDSEIDSFIFSRTLTGIQALKDSLSATGYEYRQNKVGLDVQISQMEQAFENIYHEVEEAKAEITAMNGEIVLKVDGRGRIVQVQMGIEPEKGSVIRIEADNINLSGYVTIQDLAGDGTTQINGKNITTGSIFSQNYFLRDAEGKLIYDSSHRPKKSGMGTMVNLETGYSVFSGKYRYAWLDEDEEEHDASITMDNGRIRIRDENESGSLYYSYEGISTTKDGNEASGIIDFKSKVFGESKKGNVYKGITIKTRNSPLGLISDGNHVIVSPNKNQALYDPSDKNMFDKFTFATRNRFDTNAKGEIDYGKKISDGGGILYYGKRKYNESEDRYEHSVGLELSTESTVYIVDGLGRRGEGYLVAKNIPKPVKSMSVSDKEFSFETKDGTGTYALTKDSSGRITKMDDGNGNTIKITWR